MQSTQTVESEVQSPLCVGEKRMSKKAAHLRSDELTVQREKGQRTRRSRHNWASGWQARAEAGGLWGLEFCLSSGAQERVWNAEHTRWRGMVEKAQLRRWASEPG